MSLGVGAHQLENVETEVLECLKELGCALPVDVAWMCFKEGCVPLLASVATGYVMNEMTGKGLIEFSLKEKGYRVKEAQG